MDVFSILGNINVWIFLITFVFVAIYKHVKWKFGFWERLGVPSPDYFPYIGGMGEIKKEGIFEFDKKLITKYGRIVGLYLGGIPSLLIADPEIIKNITVKEFSKAPNRFQHFSNIRNEMKHGLTTVEDDHWRFMRNTFLPTFSSGKMRKMDPLLSVKYKLLLKSLKTNTDEGKPIDFKQTFGAYTMDVIASLGFGMDIDSQTNPDNLFVKYAKALLNFSLSPLTILLVLIPKLDIIFNYFNVSPLNNRRVMGFFKSAVEKAIQMRDDGDKRRQDLLQLMINAHKDTDKNEIEEEQAIQDDQQKWKKRGLTTDEVTGNAIIFFIAGYETTASTMTFMAYCLATNPDCQERLISEIDSVIGQELPTYDNVQTIEYLDRVLNETLRLYPPATRLSRVGKTELDIGGYRIPKGIELAFAVYALHRDPEIWPEPEKFDPERFSSDKKAERHPYAFLPFGHGPRNCIGQRLATMEIKCGIVYILQHYRFKTCDETEIPLKLAITGLLKPLNGVNLLLEKR